MSPSNAQHTLGELPSWGIPKGQATRSWTISSCQKQEIVQVCVCVRTHTDAMVSEGHRCQLNDFRCPRLEPLEQENK